MRGFVKIAASALLLCSTSITWSELGEARIEQSLGYTKQQSYNAALRFLRVDNGYKITEKDDQSGYLLFEYPIRGSSETTNGSIEVIQRNDSVALIVQLPQMPRYHERMLATGLLKKLRADYGEPPRDRAPPSREEKARDGKRAPSAKEEKDDDAPSSSPASPPRKK